VSIDDLLGVIGHWLKIPDSKNGRVRSPHSLNLNIRHLKAFFGWSRRKGLIVIDPTQDDRFGFLEEPEREKPKLTVEQVNSLLRLLRENAEIPLVRTRLIEFWLWTGLRAWSEAASLRWKWVDWKERIISIPGEYTKSRKGLKRALCDPAWETLEEMHLCRQNGNPYVFPNDITGKPFRHLKETIKTLTQKAGIGNITPKDFRHLWISSTSGESSLAVQEVIGHSGLAVTQRYFHMNTDSRRQFENRVVERMTGCVPSRVQPTPPRGTNIASA
jgi:integrase